MVEGIHKIQSSTQKQHPESDAFVAIRNFYKSFNSSRMRIEIFKALDFDIRAGESLGIVGESGIGKSTFLHLLGALDRPDRGHLWFRGQDVFSFDDERLARFRNQSVGFVFQFHHLLPEFSTAENAMMPLLINGTDKKTAREAAETVLVRVGLKDRLDHRVAKLSGGEQQRVALARALVSKPAMLLADEPTGNLDKRNSAQIHELLIELNLELNMTLVVVTHNLKLASFLSRRVTISDGQLVEIE